MIVVTYLSDGEIVSVDRQFKGILASDQIELTDTQIQAFHSSPTTHGIVSGAFSSSWSKAIDPVEVESRRVAQIKSKANKAIIAIAPEWKQRNLIAKGLELTEKLAGGSSLTADELIESAAIKQIWANIQTIRADSDTAETNGTLADNFNP